MSSDRPFPENPVSEDETAATPLTTDVEQSSGHTAEAVSEQGDSSQASQPSASNGAETGGETPPAGESAPAEAASPRRVQLNPAVDPSQVKAIPSRGAMETPAAPESTQSASQEQAPPPGEAAADAATEAGEQPQPATAPAAAAPVEIPRDQELDADLEAEINAALAGGDEPPAAVEADSPEAAGVTAGAGEEEALEEGRRLKGKVQSVHGENVFVELGYRAPGVIPLRQFESAEPPAVGQELEVVVSRFDPEEGLIDVNLPRGRQRIQGNWDAVSAGQVVDCMVTKTNKGGLEVNVGNIRGFLPAGQVDTRFVSDLEPYVGQKLTVKIIEANRHKRNLVVSRRAFLEEERKAAEESLWKTLETGQRFTGTIKTIKDYGAFVDIGGVDGFLHIGQISWARINHPSEVIREGQEVEVEIVSLDEDKKKIGLSMRQLAQNPWKTAEETLAPGSRAAGRVTRIMDFGAFVELMPGVEGLVHISELDYKRVKRVSDVLKVGQEIEVQVLDVDLERQRISLSLKALKAKPEDAEGKPSDEDLAPGGGQDYVRKRKGPLKGGTGSGSGGLFGNPADFS